MPKTISVKPVEKFQLTEDDLTANTDLRTAYRDDGDAREAYGQALKGKGDGKKAKAAMTEAADKLHKALDPHLRKSGLVPADKYWTFDRRKKDKGGGLNISVWNEPQGRGGIPIRKLSFR